MEIDVVSEHQHVHTHAVFRSKKNCMYNFREPSKKHLWKKNKSKLNAETNANFHKTRARGSKADVRGILQIIPLERCPWLMVDGVRDVVSARTCTRLLHETRKAKPGQAWLAPHVSSCIAQSRNASQGGPGSIGRPGVFIGDVYTCIRIRTGHRPRITCAQFAHIKPITCFGRVIRECCPDCISDAPFNSHP